MIMADCGVHLGQGSTTLQCALRFKAVGIRLEVLQGPPQCSTEDTQCCDCLDYILTLMNTELVLYALNLWRSLHEYH
jgi:hypothetical protein